MRLRKYIQWLIINEDGFFEAMIKVRLGHQEHERWCIQYRVGLLRAVLSM
jgi:hypothetical protein